MQGGSILSLHLSCTRTQDNVYHIAGPELRKSLTEKNRKLQAGSVKEKNAQVTQTPSVLMETADRP